MLLLLCKLLLNLGFEQLTPLPLLLWLKSVLLLLLLQLMLPLLLLQLMLPMLLLILMGVSVIVLMLKSWTLLNMPLLFPPLRNLLYCCLRCSLGRRQALHVASRLQPWKQFRSQA